MNDFLISVIVSTYNRPDALRVVLDGLLRQTDRHYEIIVADDGSGPPTRAVVEEFAAKSPVPLHHVWHPDDGFRLSAIRNKGILQAKGSYLIFLDGDCVPQTDFVARHRMLSRPGMMMTGSRILLGEKLTAQVVKGLPILDQGPAFWLAQRASGEVNKILPLFFRLPDMAQRLVPGFKWRGIKGCNLAAWRSDIEKVNGFDETFTGWGHEDADFVARLHNAGVSRKKGFWSTEVLHLWHREAKRDQESPNRQKVLRRMESREMRAERGLSESSLTAH